MKNDRNTPRASNFELLRIVAMAMIVIHHFIVHVMWPGSATEGGGTLPVLSFANVFFLDGVNLFVMISGYFQIKLSWRTLIRLWLFVAFYVVLTLGCYEYYTLSHGMPGLSRTMVLLPFALFSRSGYWFLGCYFALMLFSPILNAALQSMNLRRLRQIVLLMTCFTCYSGYLLGNTNPNGYNTVQFIYLYLLGYYVGKEPRLDNVPKKIGLAVFFAASLAYGLLAARLTAHGQTDGYPLRLFAYNNPAVVLSSLGLFCCFARLRLRSKFVNRAAASMLGVYLLQESKAGYLIYDKLSLWLQHAGFSPSFFGLLLLTFAGLFVTAVLLDPLRKRICIPLAEAINSLIPEKLQLTFHENH